MTVTLTCDCCGVQRQFRSEQDAFKAGWDAPPHFTTHVCCNLCPAVCVVLGKGHSKAHAYWKEYGRPVEFDVATCATDDAFGDPRRIAALKASMGVLEDAFRDGGAAALLRELQERQKQRQ